MKNLKEVMYGWLWVLIKKKIMQTDDNDINVCDETYINKLNNNVTNLKGC